MTTIEELNRLFKEFWAAEALPYRCAFCASPCECPPDKNPVAWAGCPTCSDECWQRLIDGEEPTKGKAPG